jgi:hypothetical protein
MSTGARLEMRTGMSTMLINRIRDLVVAVLTFASACSSQAQTYEYQDREKIRIEISNREVNSLQFGNVPVVQIIGDENKFKIIPDNRARNIFLTSNVSEGEIFELKIINATGSVAHLEVVARKQRGQIINILTKSQMKMQDKNNKSQEYESELGLMLSSMIRDRIHDDKYYTSIVRRKINKEAFRNRGLLVSQDRLWRFGDLIGARLAVKNLAKGEQIELRDEEFANLFDRQIATSIEKHWLDAKKTSFVWIISKERSK